MEPIIDGNNLPRHWMHRLDYFMRTVRFHMERDAQENDATAEARLGFGYLQPLQCTVIVNVYCNAQFLWMSIAKRAQIWFRQAFKKTGHDVAGYPGYDRELAKVVGSVIIRDIPSD